MAVYAYHVVHSVSWHGREEEWATVYHYDMSVGSPSEAGFQSMIDAIVAAERPLFNTTTKFVRARVHGPTDETNPDGTKNREADIMQLATDINLTGSASSSYTLPPELAVVVEWYLGRSDKGYKQILKKFMHGAALTGTGAGDQQTRGQTALSSSVKAPFITQANTLEVIGIGGVTNTLSNAWGKIIPQPLTPTVKDYVVTRQFRRGKKRRAYSEPKNPG